MNKGYFILIALTAGFYACSKDDNPVPEDDKPIKEEPAPVRKISVMVDETPMVDGNKAAIATRGSIISTSTLSSFKMNYQSDVYTVSKTESGSTWNTEPDPWPTGDDDERLVFHAYNAGEYQYPGDYLSFIVDENAGKQKDLLVATDTVSYNTNNGKVSLVFDHACAAVDFQIYLSNTLRNKLGEDLCINSVTLENVQDTGKYSYSEGWRDLRGSASYTLTSGDFLVGTSIHTFDCGTLFMIPQTLCDTAGLNIQYTLNETTKNVFVTMNGTIWKAGTHHTAKFKLGTQQIK